MDITSYLLGKQAGGGSTPTGTINITENGVVDVTNYASADVDVQPDLESKSITISTNTTTTIEPTQGKDGLSSVEVITNVPQPSGKIEITQNGTDIDVSSYATADVSVPVGSKFENVLPNFQLMFMMHSGSNITNAQMQQQIDNIIEGVNTSTFQTLQNMCNNINSNYLITSLDFTGFNTSNVNNFSYMFAGNTNGSSLVSLNLSTFTNEANNGDVNCSNMFSKCPNLQHLDLRGFDFTKITTASNYSNMFGTTYDSVVIPSNCEIIVKDATQKAWFNNNTNAAINKFTNVKTVAEYEAS